jgi:hypothetical protein
MGDISMEANVRDWAPDIDRWPESWMGIREDREYGKKLLPYIEHFLRDLVEQGISKKTFTNYRGNVWLLGGSIISEVSLYEEYSVDPLEKLMESVENDGILPDDFEQMSESELRSFERMCRRFEKFLRKEYADDIPIREEN